MKLNSVINFNHMRIFSDIKSDTGFRFWIDIPSLNNSFQSFIEINSSTAAGQLFTYVRSGSAQLQSRLFLQKNQLLASILDDEITNYTMLMINDFVSYRNLRLPKSLSRNYICERENGTVLIISELGKAYVLQVNLESTKNRIALYEAMQGQPDHLLLKIDERTVTGAGDLESGEGSGNGGVSNETFNKFSGPRDKLKKGDVLNMVCSVYYFYALFITE
jgi:hypothetical protein